MRIIARNHPDSEPTRAARNDGSRISPRLRRLVGVLVIVTISLLAARTHAAPLDTESTQVPSALPQIKARRTPKPAPTPIPLPNEVKARVPVYQRGPVPFHDGEQLIYQASWVGIPAAQARIEFHRWRKDSNQWLAEAWIETNSVTDVFYKMRDYMREKIAVDSLHTNEVYLIQHESKRLNYFTVNFDRPAQMVTMEKKNKKGSQTRQFVASNPWGPLSGAMMALTQDFQPGKTIAFDVFSGSQRYVFAFDVQRREKISVPLGDFEAWRVVPDVWYVSDGKLRSQARGTVLWISADKRHLPLRIEAQAFIGYVRADLIRIDGKGVATNQ